MTMTDTARDTRFVDAQDFWADLDGDHPDLLFATTERMNQLAAMNSMERNRLVAGLLDFEAGLCGPELRQLLSAEMRAFSAIGPESASTILATIECYQGARPAESSMRRIEALQAACRDLSLEEIGRLESLMPTIRQLAGLPPAMHARAGDGMATGDLPARPRKRPLSRLFSRP